MKMHVVRRRAWRLLKASTVAAALYLGGSDALAVVGRPLTPVSYAGVARRTTRRSVAAGSYYGTGYYGATATMAGVATLPAGCARVASPSGTIYGCGGTYYRPYYDGPNLVYVVTPPP